MASHSHASKSDTQLSRIMLLFFALLIDAALIWLVKKNIFKISFLKYSLMGFEVLIAVLIVLCIFLLKKENESLFCKSFLIYILSVVGIGFLIPSFVFNRTIVTLSFNYIFIFLAFAFLFYAVLLLINYDFAVFVASLFYLTVSFKYFYFIYYSSQNSIYMFNAMSKLKATIIYILISLILLGILTFFKYRHKIFPRNYYTPIKINLIKTYIAFGIVFIAIIVRFFVDRYVFLVASLALALWSMIVIFNKIFVKNK